MSARLCVPAADAATTVGVSSVSARSAIEHSPARACLPRRTVVSSLRVHPAAGATAHVTRPPNTSSIQCNYVKLWSQVYWYSTTTGNASSSRVAAIYLRCPTTKCHNDCYHKGIFVNDDGVCKAIFHCPQHCPDPRGRAPGQGQPGEAP